jgi:hypothetical protein
MAAPKSFVEGIYSHQEYTKGISGVLGKAYGSIGGSFGEQGKSFGAQGASNELKYDPSKVFSLESYFHLTDHFDPTSYFNLEELGNNLVQNAVTKATGGK